jgi:hypothetical protein
MVVGHATTQREAVTAATRRVARLFDQRALCRLHETTPSGSSRSSQREMSKRPERKHLERPAV